MENNLLHTDEDKCPVCHSQDICLELENSSSFVDNFYLKAIRDELDISVEELRNKLRVYECSECRTIFCNPWFTAEASFKIFNQIYGQHNRGWDALYGWTKHSEVQDYWNIVNIGEQVLGRELDSYAEYHCPFQGNFFKFRSQELPKDQTVPYYKVCRNYLTASTPGRIASANVMIKSRLISFSRDRNKTRLKRLDESVTPIRTKRYLALESSTRFWDYSCLSSGVNCKSLASKLLNINVMPLPEFVRQKQFIDVFAFINTLDHCHAPLELLEQALEISEVVFLVSHTQKLITKQHKFIFQPGFASYLEKEKGLNVLHLDQSEKNYFSTEVCEDKLMLMITKP
jgi:hypothetical protein